MFRDFLHIHPAAAAVVGFPHIVVQSRDAVLTTADYVEDTTLGRRAEEPRITNYSKLGNTEYHSH